MNPPYEQRLHEIRDTRQSNCRGTALYLAGLINEDEYVSSQQAFNPHLYSLNPISFPWLFARSGDIITWQSQTRPVNIRHMAVVTSRLPLLVTQRIERNGVIEIDVPFKDACPEYLHDRVVFYRVPATATSPKCPNLQQNPQPRLATH